MGYNIAFPSQQHLRAIVTNRLGEHIHGLSDYLDDALDLFERLHDPAIELRKRPSTAELLGWIRVLRHHAPDAANPVRERQDILEGSLGALIKTAEDQEIVWPVVTRSEQAKRIDKPLARLRIRAFFAWLSTRGSAATHGVVVATGPCGPASWH